MQEMRLPLFPLHTVLFPHLPLPIHCFEERYRIMARDVTADGSPFAGRFVVSMITAGSDVGDDREFEPIGTVCEVRSAEQFSDGRWLLLVVGLQRGRVTGIERSAPYAVASLDPIEDPVGDSGHELVPHAQRALDAYLATVKRFVVRTASVGGHAPDDRDMSASLDDILKAIRLPADPVAASYAIAGMLQVELARKQRLLELSDATSRLRAEISLLRREAKLLGDGELPTAPSSDLGYNPN